MLVMPGFLRIPQCGVCIVSLFTAIITGDLMTSLPFALVTPADEFGCGYYRMRWPLEALDRLGLAQGVISPYFLDRETLVDLAPDVVVCQRVLEEDQIARLKAMRNEITARFV